MGQTHKHRVLLAEALDPPSEARLEAACQVLRPAQPDAASLAALLPGCDALIVRTHQRVTRELLQSADRLRCIGVAGVGTENVDLQEAEQRGIVVLNRPAAASDAVAELTIGLILNLLRSIGPLTDAYRNGAFAAARKTARGGELRELCVGIVGMGRIGSRVGRICAAGFGARVLYNDIVPLGPFEFAADAVEKHELWPRADVLTLHVPLTPLTRGLISAEVLRQMRPGALLVNTARGAVVETTALLAALRDGRLAGAALDVTDPEPLPADHELFSHPNCLLTPHVAARTVGGLRRMFEIVDDVMAFLEGRAGFAR